MPTRPVFSLLLLSLIAFSIPAAASDMESHAKKRLLVVSIPPSDNLPKDEASLLDGILCAEADKPGVFTVLCTSSIEDAKQFNDFSFKSGGNGCEGGWCVEAMIQKYQPDLIVRIDAKKSGSNIEISMKLLDKNGTSTLGSAKKTLNTKDELFIEKMGQMLVKLVAPKPPPQVTPPPPPPAEKQPEKLTEGK
jgi:hypothetical protein